MRTGVAIQTSNYDWDNVNQKDKIAEIIKNIRNRKSKLHNFKFKLSWIEQLS